MIRQLELVLLPEQVTDTEQHKLAASALLNISVAEITGVHVIKRSIDARSKTVKYRLLCDIYFGEPYNPPQSPSKEYQSVHHKKCAIIVGSGPAGLFAALRLIELGVKPIVIERGKDVQARRRDLAAINKEHIVNPNSNYCFGEGGAGTYSDGKLYTRSTKRGDVQKILRTMIAHGANPNIAVDAHPHIGTNKLPKLIEEIRNTIIELGGEIHFNKTVTDFIIEHNAIKGVVCHDGSSYESKVVILATGHSARDIYELLHAKNILIEAKPFALGVRIEHPQHIIDSVQYHCDIRSEFLPAASYSLAHQANGRGVYSFCMCPGGFIVPAATEPGELVVNGMSPSRRDSKYANSGMVVAVELSDLAAYQNHGPMAALRFQQEIERKAFVEGGRTQAAPAQRMIDFIKNKVSSSLPDTSYQPGTTSTLLTNVLPPFISSRLQEGFQAFGKKMKPYLTNEAILLGVESRTSSPVRIPRDKETLEHPQIKGLYPCAEGAGYAGGIVSAAIDGELCAEACIVNL